MPSWMLRSRHRMAVGRVEGAVPFSGSASEDCSSAESTVGQGASKRRTKTKRCRDAQEEDDVSRRSQEDRSGATSAMGEGEGCGKEVSVTTAC
jgi:hypothetical protein